MKRNWFLAGLAVIALRWVSASCAQSAPDIVWEVTAPNGLNNSIVGVGWTSGISEHVSLGSIDRWLRTRKAKDGALDYSIFGPQRSRGADQTIYSVDDTFLAVHNVNNGLNYQVYRVADGLFLGTILVTVDLNGLVHFAPDSQLQSSVPKDGTMRRWRFDQFTVVVTTGTGFDMVTTTNNFSPNGLYQSVASRGIIEILSRKNGSRVTLICGGAFIGFTPITFTPDSSAIAGWDPDTNHTMLWRATDATPLRQFQDLFPNEGVAGIRFTPDGTRMITSGYYAFQDNGGNWQQIGYVRFWRITDSALRQQFTQHTGIAVTSAIAFSPDATQFVYGTYEGTAVVAHTPAP